MPEWEMSIMLFFKYILISLSVLMSLTAASQDSCWVQVRIPVACIRDGKGHSTEMTSQAIMGMPLMLLEDDAEWLKKKSPDGYEGYMNVSSVSRKTNEEMDAWKKAKRFVSTSLPELKLYSTPDMRGSRNVVSEIVLGSILEGHELNDSVLSLKLSDGRMGYGYSKDFVDAETWATQILDLDGIVDKAYCLMGTPYLWGACSTKSVDCSGLVRVTYFSNGVLTLRDARQQIEIGKRIAPDDIDSLERGDLLFFSNTPDGRISHVAIYDNDKRYIHSSGLVKTNYMNRDDSDFSKRFYRGASRIKGMEDTPGIIRMINHPWYFNTDSKIK